MWPEQYAVFWKCSEGVVRWRSLFRMWWAVKVSRCRLTGVRSAVAADSRVLIRAVHFCQQLHNSGRYSPSRESSQCKCSLLRHTWRDVSKVLLVSTLWSMLHLLGSDEMAPTYLTLCANWVLWWDFFFFSHSENRCFRKCPPGFIHTLSALLLGIIVGFLRNSAGSGNAKWESV